MQSHYGETCYTDKYQYKVCRDHLDSLVWVSFKRLSDGRYFHRLSFDGFEVYENYVRLPRDTFFDRFIIHRSDLTHPPFGEKIVYDLD